MKKILIADDSLFMRKILSDALSGKYEVVESDSEASTLAQFKSQKPDLVLLDIIMPQVTEAGVEVLAAIKKIDPNAKIIMLTAVGHQAIIEECKKLGASDYITKPFDTQAIVSAVARCLG
jgi:two-component system chemotaxis response regulator CheY